MQLIDVVRAVWRMRIAESRLRRGDAKARRELDAAREAWERIETRAVRQEQRKFV